MKCIGAATSTVYFALRNVTAGDMVREIRRVDIGEYSSVEVEVPVLKG